MFPESTSAEPSVGELRFIARLSSSTLPNGPTQSIIRGGSAIEGSDVFLVDGQTRSKCTSCSNVCHHACSNLHHQHSIVYSSKRFIEDQIHGVTGSNIDTRPLKFSRARLYSCFVSRTAAWMIIPRVGYESSSGGPFFRYAETDSICVCQNKLMHL